MDEVHSGTASPCSQQGLSLNYQGMLCFDSDSIELQDPLHGGFGKTILLESWWWECWELYCGWIWWFSSDFIISIFGLCLGILNDVNFGLSWLPDFDLTLFFGGWIVPLSSIFLNYNVGDITASPLYPKWSVAFILDWTIKVMQGTMCVLLFYFRMGSFFSYFSSMFICTVMIFLGKYKIYR